MNDPQRHHWPAQEPDPDFAARTAQLILDAQQSGPLSKRVRSGVRWKKPGFLLCAAVFVSASAWGAMHAVRYFAQSEAVRPPAVTEPVAPPSVATVPAKVVEVEPRSAPEPPPVAPPRKVTPALTVPSVASTSAEPTAVSLPIPRVPPCWCDPGAVLCGCAD
jgi:hypothetical protein